MTRALARPGLAYAASYRAYIRELGDEERYPFPLDFDHADFAALLARLDDLEAGRNLPPGRVASSTWWLVESGELIGVSNLRYRLNQDLWRCGGHIGFGVRPSHRGRGIGTLLMSLTLRQAWQRGIADVHVHCHKANRASARIIEACGGVLHSEIEEGPMCQVVQRYVVGAPRGQDRPVGAECGEGGS